MKWSLISGTAAGSGLVLHISCPSSWISDFSLKSWLLLQTSALPRPQPGHHVAAVKTWRMGCRFVHRVQQALGCPVSFPRGMGSTRGL